MQFAFIFPGQGSQKTGMGKDLADNFTSAREVFEEVDQTLGQELSKIMWEGSMEELTLTANTQPALMACSMAVMRVLRDEFDIGVELAKYVAGHSLGEYSALCATGSLTLADTAKLLRLRGNSMQESVPVGEGAMAALLGADIKQAEQSCMEGQKYGICQIANDNADGQIVISGHKQAVESACDAAAQMGVKRAVILPVSAPFHCDLMKPAAIAMQEALQNVELKTPIVPLVNNVTASAITDIDKIKSDLVKQVTGKVRWRESVLYMAKNGIEAVIEPGNGTVLLGMMRRIDKQVKPIKANSVEALEKLAKLLK